MHEKLIRDRIPEIAAAQGRTLDLRSARAAEWDRLLGLKLVEETHEVIGALATGDRSALLDELADLQTVLDEVARRNDISKAEVDLRASVKRAERGGFDLGLVLQEGTVRDQRLHIGGNATLLDAIRHEFESCAVARIAVAFVMRSGIELFEGPALAALLRGAEVRMLTTDYLGVTEPEALDRMCAWQGRFEARVYSHARRSFHPKAYLFERTDGTGRAFIGSANLSRMGLLEGVEWTWTVLDVDAGQPMHELRTRFDELFGCDDTASLSPSWIQAYRQRRQVRPFTDQTAAASAPAIEPRQVQLLALQELERLRADGQTKALVVAATGLGKTFLAAFDAREAQRVLFIAHREELLRQAAAAFQLVYPGRSCGLVVDGLAEYDRDFVFASVQTLSRTGHLSQGELARFDYVVIDEFHHAAADSYRKILDALSPRFLLGLTATPFRGDNRDLLELCDGNLAYQVGLFESIGFGWLVPFRYFGVADTVVYTEDLLTARKTYDAGRLTLRFNTQDRADLVIGHFRRHESKATLGFCISIENADYMAARFNAAGVPAAAVHSGEASMNRTEAVRRLKLGELVVLFTVDMFNEGVDIPVVDLVMFLRPTESMTVFLQQLGRGLRLSDGKEYLTVLDFIGNYRNAHFKLPLLAGQDLTRDLDPAKALALLTRWQKDGSVPAGIPEGIRVEFEPVALGVLHASVQAASPLRQLVLADLTEVVGRLGRTPTLTEWQLAGRYSPKTTRTALGVDRWHSVLQVAGLLDTHTQALEESAGEFLREIEAARMTKSFKMVVLLAMCEGGSFRGSIGMDELIRYFRAYFAEDRHREDVIGTPVEDAETVTSERWSAYLLANPINAWIGGNTGAASPYFRWSASTSALKYIGPSQTDDPAMARSVGSGVADRATAQLHAYWQRPGPGRFVYPVIPVGGTGGGDAVAEARTVCIMFGADKSGLPVGWHLIAINGKHLYGKFVKVALNVLKAAPTDSRDQGNMLTGELETLFGGRLPARPRVRFVKAASSSVWQILVA